MATKRSFDDTSGIRLQPFGSFVNGLSTWNRWGWECVIGGVQSTSSCPGMRWFEFGGWMPGHSCTGTACLKGWCRVGLEQPAAVNSCRQWLAVAISLASSSAHSHSPYHPYSHSYLHPALSCSDVDLVVTGLVQPDPATGGFAPSDKRLVFTALERIARQLRG